MRKAFALFLLLVPSLAYAQYMPSKAQHEKLAKQKAKLLKMQLEIARLQTEIVFEVGNLDRICREVAVSNRWPADVACNAQNLTFAAPPPPPVTATLPQAPPPAAVPTEPKKP